MEIIIVGLLVAILIILVLQMGKKGTSSDNQLLDKVTVIDQDIKRIDSNDIKLLDKLVVIDSEVKKIEQGFIHNFERQLNNNNTTSEKIMKSLYESQKSSESELNKFEKVIIDKFHEETINNANFTNRQKIELLNILEEKLDTTHLRFNTLSNTLIEQIDDKLKNEISTNAKTKEEIISEVRLNLDKIRTENNKSNSEFLERIENSFKKSNDSVNLTVNDLKKEVGMLIEKQEQLADLGVTIKDFNNVLSNSKLRGLFGEQTMELILENYFGAEGKLWSKQFRLKNGLTPDAVIHCQEPIGELAIDAKFPLDNYRKMMSEDISDIERLEYKKAFKNDLKARLKEVCKYVKEDELANQAVMFIPAEAIFIEICANFPDIIEEGYKHNVWITGPTTLMATLSTVKISIEKVKLNENAEEILVLLDALSKEFVRFDKRNSDLEKHLDKFVEEYKNVSITSKKISSQFEKIQKMK